MASGTSSSVSAAARTVFNLSSSNLCESSANNSWLPERVASAQPQLQSVSVGVAPDRLSTDLDAITRHWPQVGCIRYAHWVQHPQDRVANHTATHIQLRCYTNQQHAQTGKPKRVTQMLLTQTFRPLTFAPDEARPALSVDAFF